MQNSVENEPVVEDEMTAIRSALIAAFADDTGDDLSPALTDLIDRLRKALANRSDPFY